MFGSSKKNRRIVDRTYEEITTTTWEEARSELQVFSESWMFRGHRDADWRLETPLDRENTAVAFGMPPEAAEQHMLSDFQRRAHHFVAAQQLPTATLDWLALMQHHGAPTRLLDWTRSSFVAAYFAVENVKTDGQCAIWCLNHRWCLQESQRILGTTTPRNSPVIINPSDPAVFDSQILRGTLQLVVPVEPFLLNERMTTQQGLFACAGDLDVTFVDNLRALGASELPQNLVKIILQGWARGQALEELNQANVNRATLFPGIDGGAIAEIPARPIVAGVSSNPGAGGSLAPQQSSGRRARSRPADSTFADSRLPLDRQAANASRSWPLTPRQAATTAVRGGGALAATRLGIGENGWPTNPSGKPERAGSIPD